MAFGRYCDKTQKTADILNREENKKSQYIRRFVFVQGTFFQISWHSVKAFDHNCEKGINKVAAILKSEGNKKTLKIKSHRLSLTKFVYSKLHVDR